MGATSSKFLKTSKFWDIVVVREDGEWVGFRIPWSSLRRVLQLLAFVFILCALASTGWLLSRWQVGRLSSSWAAEKLRSAALEAQLADLRAHSHPNTNVPAPAAAGGSPASTTDALSSFSLLPALNGEELRSPTVEWSELNADYDASSHDLALKFELVRKPPREGSARYFWIALVHGPQGLMIYPSALGNRNGEALMFHRGEPLDDVRVRRAVSARYKLEGFMERAGSEPVFATFLIYDSKGSLLLRRRAEVAVRRSSGGSAQNNRGGNET